MRISRKDELLRALDNLSVSSSNLIEDFAEILQACIALKEYEEGKHVYAYVTSLGMENHVMIGNKIINLFIRSGSMIDAKNTLSKLPTTNVISWTSIVGGYAIHGRGFDAFETYEQMKSKGVSPNKVTFLCLLDAAGCVPGIGHGQMVYSEIVDSGMDSDIMIGTALVDMYSKSGSIEDACCVFDTMVTRDVILCTAMINSFSQHGLGREAVKLFEQMVCEGIEPNEYTYTSILTVCASLVDLMQGQKVHILILRKPTVKVSRVVGAALVHMYSSCGRIQEAHVVFEKLEERDVTAWTALITGYAHNGIFKVALKLLQQMQAEPLESDVVVGNAFIDLFFKCGNLIDARTVFDKMLTKDIISWSTLISGYAQQGFNIDAIELYSQMLRENISPDEYTVGSVLQACANLTALLEGMVVHACTIEFGLNSDIVVQNSILNLYAKCNSMTDAKAVFNQVPYPDAEAFNTMILGYANHSCGNAAYDLYERFLITTSKPDEYTFSGVLKACAISHMLSVGKEVHMHIIRTGFDANNVVANALTDMYTTCGSLKEAFSVFSSMTDKELISWSSMIGGCAQHGYEKDVMHLYQHMQQEGFKQDQLTLSSILVGCNYAGHVDEGCFFFKMMSNDHLMILTPEHYGCVVDLLCRSGRLYEAMEFTYRMPMQPLCIMWVSLLAACRQNDIIKLADFAANYAFEFGSQSSSAYVLLSNMYVNFSMGSIIGNNSILDISSK